MSVIHFPRAKRRARKNPQWLLDLAHGTRALRMKIGEFRRLRRTGLHPRASFWCAWNYK